MLWGDAGPLERLMANLPRARAATAAASKGTCLGQESGTFVENFLENSQYFGSTHVGGRTRAARGREARL